jgi:5'-nucleotidase
MPKFPADLKNARVLISNDDSVNAEGIKVLEEIISAITPHVWVVAPETQMSAASHSLTIHSPLRLREIDKRHYAVSGTPTDSVMMGVMQVMKDFRPDLVISGINHGQNAADDVTYSGTIAAAIEACLMGIPAVACSQDFDEITGRPDWTIAREYLPKILHKLAGRGCDNFIVMNVNFPKPRAGLVPKIAVVPQGHYYMTDQAMVPAVDPRGKPYYWIGPPPRRTAEDLSYDGGALTAGHVTLTPLSLNLTHHPTMKSLQEVFA